MEQVRTKAGRFLSFKTEARTYRVEASELFDRVADARAFAQTLVLIAILLVLGWRRGQF